MTTSLTLVAALEAMEAGEMSAVELLESSLDSIESQNGDLNAFLRVRPSGQLLEQARVIDQARHDGEDMPALAGVPVGLKDNFGIEGVDTTAGSPVLDADWHAGDSSVTAALRQQGCIILGSTNMHEFADGPTTDNPHYGRAQNPHRHGHTPGGSSGGSAAAVGTGMCLGATGTDTGGSIRTPAAFCGIVGMKPTFGAVSRAGIYPFSWSLDHAGPMARTVEDVAVLMRGIVGVDPADPATAPPPPDNSTPSRTDRPTVAYDTAYFTRYLTPGVRQSFDQALSTLEDDLGFRVIETELPAMDQALDVLVTILFSEATTLHRESLESRLGRYGRDVRLSLLSGRFYSGQDYVHAQRIRGSICRSFEAVFESADFFVTPTVVMEAPEWDTQTFQVGDREMGDLEAYIRCTSPFNLTGSPVLSVPCGYGANDLPIGLQLVGPQGSDFDLLHCGRQFENRTTSRR